MVGLVAKILYKFELKGRVYERDKKSKMKTREERGEREAVRFWGGREQVRKKRGTCANYKSTPPHYLSLIFGPN